MGEVNGCGIMDVFAVLVLAAPSDHSHFVERKQGRAISLFVRVDFARATADGADESRDRALDNF